MRRGWGTALALRRHSAGGAPAFLALGLADWDWGADGLIVHMLAIGIPATMAAAVALDLLARPGSLAIGERAGLVVAPRPAAGGRVDGSRCSAGTGSSCAWRAARVSGRSSPSGRQGRGVGRSGRRASAPGARGGRRRLHQARTDRRDPRRPPAARGVRGARRRCRTGLRPNRSSSAPGARSRARRPTDESLRRVRLGATRRGVDRPDLPRPAADGRGRRRQGAATGRRRRSSSATSRRSSLLAGFAQRRTPFGQGLRSGEVLEQFAREPAGRARLPARGRRDGGDDRAARGHVRRAGPEGLPASSAPGGLLVQERFEGFTVADVDALDASEIDRTALAEQLLACYARPGAALGFFHADPHPGNIFVFHDGTLGLIDFGAVGRLDPIQQAAVVDMLAALRAARRRACCATASSGSPTSRDTVSPSGSSGHWRGSWPRHIRPTGSDRPGDPAGPRRRCSPEFGIRLPADLVVLSRALVTLDGTLRVMSPGLVDGHGGDRAASRTAGLPVVDPQDAPKNELVAALPQLRRLPDRIDRILTLTEPGRSADPARGRRGRPAHRAHARQPRAAGRRGDSVVLLVVGDAARRRRRRARWSPAAPACSRCSATAVCSPAPCCCSAWWPPSLGTGRRDHVPPTTRRHRDAGANRPSTRLRAAGRAVLPPSRRRRAAGALGGRRRCSSRSSSARHEHDRRADRRPRAGRRSHSPVSVRELVLALTQVVALSRCRPLVVVALVVAAALAATRDPGAGRARCGCGALARARLRARSARPAARRGDERHVGRVDALPVVGLPRRRRGRGDGRQAVARPAVAAGDATSHCSRSRVVMAAAGSAGVPELLLAIVAGRRASVPPCSSSSAHPNRRPAPAAVAAALGDGGPRRLGARARSAPTAVARSCTSPTTADGGRVVRQGLRTRQPRRRPSLPRLPDAPPAGSERRSGRRRR